VEGLAPRRRRTRRRNEQTRQRLSAKGDDVPDLSMIFGGSEEVQG